MHELSSPAGPEEGSAQARRARGPGTPWVRDFSDLTYEWRRLSAELLGTFMLVLVAAGGGVVAALSGGQVGRVATVVAPALMVMAMILATGAVSGAHLNPVVSIAFALRQEFPWRRVPAYLVAQAAGGVLACLVLSALFGDAGDLGATTLGAHVTGGQGLGMESLLAFGLVTTILGTASGAQNVGPLSALAVGGYIALAGLWSSPVSGASMNPIRSLAPDVVLWHYADWWVYVAGPLAGMLAAVAAAFVLRGPGSDSAAARAAQGTLGTVVIGRRDARAQNADATGGPPGGEGGPQREPGAGPS